MFHEKRLIESVVVALEMAGVCVLVLGLVLASALFLREVLVLKRPFEDSYPALRANLGRSILLGLEFLVGADIIGTVAVDPTYETVGVLGLIVLIRTFLSFALETEIEGRLPWKRS